jgi:hypothetical protein
VGVDAGGDAVAAATKAEVRGSGWHFWEIWFREGIEVCVGRLA